MAQAKEGKVITTLICNSQNRIVRSRALGKIINVGKLISVGQFLLIKIKINLVRFLIIFKSHTIVRSPFSGSCLPTAPLCLSNCQKVLRRINQPTTNTCVSRVTTQVHKLVTIPTSQLITTCQLRKKTFRWLTTNSKPGKCLPTNSQITIVINRWIKFITNKLVSRTRGVSKHRTKGISTNLHLTKMSHCRPDKIQREMIPKAGSDPPGIVEDLEITDNMFIRGAEANRTTPTSKMIQFG